MDNSTAFKGKFWVNAIFGSEVLSTLEDIRNKSTYTVNVSQSYEKLRKYRLYILSLDGYWCRWNFFKIQCYIEWFSDMEVEGLLEIFNKTDKSAWEQDREYFYALFNIIEDKLKEKGIDLGFTDLFEQGI